MHFYALIFAFSPAIEKSESGEIFHEKILASVLHLSTKIGNPGIR